MMDVKEIQELMEAFTQSALTELELNDKEFSLKLKREITISAPAAHPLSGVASAAPVSGLSAGGSVEEPAVILDEDVEYIKSPIIGTFYRAPNPDADNYVNVGDTIRKGQVLCIIEAMKIMNEIEAEVEGTVVKVCPKNAEAVEYGQQLFAIKPL